MTVRHLTLVGLLVLLLSACAGGVEQLTDSGADDAAHGEAEPAEGHVDEEQAPSDGGEGAVAFRDADVAVGSASQPGEAPLPQAPGTGERLVKEGTMTIEVAEGRFLTAFQSVVASARELGGFVTASTSRSTDDGGTRGSVTVRVPVDRYEDLLARVAETGELRMQDVTSRDVTAEFTDLQSRLRHLRAQEAFYLELLEEAESVQDAITVKQHLDEIQAQVEQTQGRLNVLEDRTSYSTLTVEIVEPGTEPLVALNGTQPMLADYWETARNGFVRVIGWMLVSSVSLAPLLLPAVLAALLWRVARKRPQAPAAEAVQTDV